MDYKILLLALAESIQQVFPDIVNRDQTTCVKYRNIIPSISIEYTTRVENNGHISRPISTASDRGINLLTAGAEYIGFFTQLLPHSVPPFKHVKAIM